MRQSLLVSALASALLSGSTGTFAQEPGNVAAGHRIAQQWCSECHKVDPAQRLVDPEAEAPTFEEVANDPSTTPLSLRVFFQSSHENMPDLHISQSQADDLVAYILSLKKEKAK
jgi:mono/diheme cytochrome c family protein